MAINLATAYVQIVPSMKGVGKAITDAFDKNSTAAGVKGGKAAGSGFAAGMKAKMGAVIGVASSITTKAMDTIGSSISSALNRADQMNNFPKVMKNLGYSADDAAKSVRKIADSLDGLPTTSSAMTGMVQQLAPLTSSLDEATTISLAFNNAMLAGGASTMEQENALAQYCQMLAAGQVDMAAWRSIQAAMPGQLNQVAEAMLGAGHNANDLYDAMKEGTIGFDEFNAAIVDLNENGFGQYASFAQQAKDATQGIGTAIENTKNRVAKAIQKVIEAFGVENIAGAINGFSSQFSKIGDAAASMVTTAKEQIGFLFDRMRELGAFDELKNAWNNLIDLIKGIDWGTILPTGAWEQFRNTAASALADLSHYLAVLIDWLGQGIQWVSDFVAGFASTGAFEAWIDVLGVVLDVLSSFMDTIGSVIGSIGDLFGMSGGASSFGETLGNAFRTAAQLIQPLLEVLDNILQWFSANPGIITTALIAIGGGFSIFKGVPAILGGVTKGLDSVFSAATTVKNGAQAITNAINGIGGVTGTIKQWAGTAKLAQNAQLAWSQATQAGTTIQRTFKAVTQSVSGGISGIAGSLKGAIGGIKALSAAMGLGPWGLIIAAISAVVSALIWFFTQTEVGRKAWAAFTQWLGNLWNSICEIGKAVWQGLSDFFTGLWEGIKAVAEPIWQGLSDFFTNIWNGMKAVWDVVWNGIKAVFEVVWGLIQAYVNYYVIPIFNLIKNACIVVAAVFVSIWNGIKSVWETVWQAMVDFFTPIIEAISNTITTVCTWISETWNTVWTAVKDFFVNLWNGIVAFFTPIINGIRDTITTVVNAIKSTWDSVWNAISNFFKTIWNGIVSFFTPIINGIRNTITNAVNAIRNTWNSTWSSISNFFSGIWDGMKNAVGNAVGFIGDKVRGIKDVVMNALSGAGNWLVDTGRNLIQGLINGIGDMFGWVRDKILGLGRNILGWAKGVLGIGSPSRIFKQYGRWLDEGLAIGITDATGEVRHALDDMTGIVADVSIPFDPLDGYTPPDTGRGKFPFQPGSASTAPEPPATAAGGNTYITQTINNPVAQPWPIQSANDSDHRFNGI